MELPNRDYDCNFIQPTIVSSTEEWEEMTTYYETTTNFITTTKTDVIDDFSISTLTTVPTIESSSTIIPSSTLNNNLSTTTDKVGYSETDFSSEMSSTNFITTEISNFNIISTEEMEETSKIPLEMENATNVDSKTTESYDTTETPVSATEPSIYEFSTISPFFTDHPTESRHTIEEFSSTSILEQTTTMLSIESTYTTNWDAATAASADNITKGVSCMKTPCYNGGTCVNTSEGSRVRYLFLIPNCIKNIFLIIFFQYNYSVSVVLITRDIYVNRL